MQRFVPFFAALVVLCGTTSGLYASTILGASAGPNDTSSDFSSWGQHAVDGLQAGVSAKGSPSNEPEYWNPISSAKPEQFVISSFNSWDANASPSDPDEQDEFGTGVYTGVAIERSSDFRGGDLEYSVTSQDISGRYSVNLTGDYSSAEFKPWRVGIAEDGTVYDGGEAMDEKFIRKLYLAGVGVGHKPDSSWSGTNQELLDMTVSDFTSNLGDNSQYNWEYTLKDGIGNTINSENKSVTVVPSPSALSAGTVGLLTFSMFRFLRRRRT
jgi:hypothetical protein